MNILINVKGVDGINQNKLIQFLQGQNANSVKRHLNHLKNRKNLAQKKAYINAQLEHQDFFQPIVSQLQNAGLILNKDFTKNQLARNSTTIVNLGSKLQSVGMYKNPYLRLLFTATNKVKQSLDKDPSGKNLQNIVSSAEKARQQFMAKQFMAASRPRIPSSLMGSAFQQTINLNKRIRKYFGNNSTMNLSSVTSKPDFVKFLNRRGPKKPDETLNTVRKQFYTQSELNRLGLNQTERNFFKKLNPTKILNRTNLTNEQKIKALRNLKSSTERVGRTIMFSRS